MVPQQTVEVVAAEHIVAVACQHLGHIPGDLDDRDIECPAAEIIDHHPFGDIGVHRIDKRGRRRLVDDPDDLQPGKLSGVLGGLALGITEVGRHGDHRF